MLYALIYVGVAIASFPSMAAMVMLGNEGRPAPKRSTVRAGGTALSVFWPVVFAIIMLAPLVAFFRLPFDPELRNDAK
jgi:hypothetical protein